MHLQILRTPSATLVCFIFLRAFTSFCGLTGPDDTNHCDKHSLKQSDALWTELEVGMTFSSLLDKFSSKPKSNHFVSSK